MPGARTPCSFLQGRYSRLKLQVEVVSSFILGYPTDRFIDYEVAEDELEIIL